uniref:Uncharacterized protein n=1 Tax=Globodera rostochiensis TaxID=31243 RepID=A0A914HB91_GLORO
MRTFLFLCAICLLVASILLETDASSKKTNKKIKKRPTSSGNAENAGSSSSWFHRDTTPQITPKPLNQSLSTSNQGHQRSTAATSPFSYTGSSSTWFRRDTTPQITPKPLNQSLSTSNQGHQRSTAAATSSSSSRLHRDTTPKIMPNPVNRSSNQGHQRSTAATSAFSRWSIYEQIKYSCVEFNVKYANGCVTSFHLVGRSGQRSWVY